MISTLLLRQDRKTFTRVSDPNRISDLRQAPQHVLWVDVSQPTPQDFDRLREEFGFHHLAIEDCRNAHQRPKIEDYHGYYFIVLYEAELTESGELVLRELALFLGANYVVTVHHDAIRAIASGERLWRDWTDLADQGAGLLTYLILDAVVDAYFPILDTMSDRMDDMEDRLFNDQATETLEDIFQIKKQLLHLRRSVTPLRDVFNILLRREQPLFTRDVIYYFHDIHDHLIRVADSIDNLRDLLGSTMDVYLSQQNNRMNMVMKRLTALSTILMSAALVSGIYGMNFQYMPELAWKYGYFVALGAMLVIVVGLVIFFRWIKWL
ncbi:MAG TPA: magnesium/cobalt transporter CorA [Blastocatellia bacterium]|nr:magnesium/cobalt transporter CorA [Blastocatellia bacterium]